jgi:hypothetical protein
MQTAPGLRTRRLFIGLATICVLWGCGQPAREDRSIHFSSDGGQVGFQHGNEGVFLANPNGGPPRKIFQPSADVIAVSTPLWAPGGKEVVFCTATGTGQLPPTLGLTGSQDDPAGRLFGPGPITYTCWKFDASSPPGTNPQQLFSAGLDHAGYVAANLAVRWHPREPKLYFLSQAGTKHVGLYEWDMTTNTQKQVFPETAEGMIFDWTPDGSQLACVLGFNQPGAVVNGTWIGKPGNANWWHVPGSENLAQSELPSLLETLRASRPIFTKDGSTFAFVTSTTVFGSPPSVDHAVNLGNIEQHSVMVAAHGKELFRDLVWQPDGKSLGLVQANGATGSLHTLSLDGILSSPLNARPVRQFAGWNNRGDELAYITPEQIPTHRQDFWSFLMVPDPLARDTVVLRPGSTQPGAKEQELLNGLRVTFPQWSPKENKLSLWVTFAPPYRSWLWIFLRLGLRPGDPAAVFDVASGKLSWLAVNDYEKTQVGRYAHLKKDYKQAWDWYEQGKDAGAPVPAQMTTMTGLPVANDQLFYEYLCLTKLGRMAEAEARRARFEAAFVVPPAAKLDAKAPPQPPAIPELAERIDLFVPLMRDFLIAEVYASLDEVDEAATFFRVEAEHADTDSKRLSALFTLSQILLIQGKNEEYLDLCATKLVGLIMSDAKSHSAHSMQGSVTELIASCALAPLAASDFVKLLPRERVERWLPTWRKLAAETTPQIGGQTVQFILYVALERLGKDVECAAIRKRMETMNASHPIFGNSVADANKGIGEFRKQLVLFLTGF